MENDIQLLHFADHSSLEANQPKTSSSFYFR